MAKIAFSKLGLKKQEQIKTVSINDQTVEVKQYLPINDKLQLITRVLQQAADENNFSNPIKLELFTSLEIVFAYSNLSFTEKQKADLVKLYDLLEENDIFNQIIAVIPTNEYQSILDGVQKCSDAIYTYRNSLLGILDVVASDYTDLDFDATKIQNVLADPQNLSLLKDVVSKLG